jgi:hypothetical protein
MARPELTDARRADADRIYAALREACDTDLRQLAELLASKSSAEFFGATEFDVRDRVHAIGDKALQAALVGRQRGATAAPAPAAPTAADRPSSNAGNPSRS